MQSFSHAGAQWGIALALIASLWPGAALAQTDYYNTDEGRPVRVEDAYPTERFAFELQLAPVRVQRAAAGVYEWSVEPEIAYGILPHTHVEIGFPITGSEARGAEAGTGLAGIELSVLHNLNVETSGLPAFALTADATLPVGSRGPDDVDVGVKAIATRTFRLARLHLNARYAFEESLWFAGLALDRALPLRSLLVIGEVVAEETIEAGGDVEWSAGAGMRYQLNPVLALDAGLARRITGPPSWSLTFGSAYAFGVRALMPGRVR